jgi:thiol:disulfide interchange protein
MYTAPLRSRALARSALFAAASVVAVGSIVATSAARAADAKPATPDSRPGIRPKEVTLAPSVEPTEARPGQTVTFRVTAKLKPGWHIYKYSTQAQDSVGPRNTTFDLFDTGGLKVAGEWTPSRPPIEKPEPAFGNKVLKFYEDEVTWSIPLQVPPGTEPGKKTLRVQAGYQICNDSTCKIPGQWTLPEVTLTVLPGGAADASPAPAPEVKTASAATAVPAPAEGTKGEPPAGSADEEPTSEVAQRAEQGLISFLLFSAGGGLLALVMPCVWPMIPITVNFFVKQGHHSKGKTTGLAITYCLAIIGVFTTFGVLVSFFFSATALQKFANYPWLNVFVALAFLYFGLNLLGVFEIGLPSFLLNASARGESRGGLVGIIFMALTLTITSFTCTFPVVGGLIVMAAKGQFFYPIIGLATFSAVLAFPFFLLALAPGLLSRMPKSGDWMNAVKVVGGLVEIGAAFKFVNTAEIGFGAVPSDAWFNAPMVLAIWVVLAVVCGVYLLGLFRTDHDHDEVKIGPGRLLTGCLFLAMALYFAPALFGRAPKGQLWNQLVGLFPPDINDMVAPGVSGLVAGTGLRPSKATSTIPEVAEKEQTSFHGVLWGMSYEAARERARAENKPILIDFTGVNCANCRKMESAVMPRPEVVERLNRFVTVQLYTDYVPIASLTQPQREALATKNQDLLLDLTDDPSNPFYAILSPEGKVLASIGGDRPPKVFVKFLDDALGKQTKGVSKVAQASGAG